MVSALRVLVGAGSLLLLLSGLALITLGIPGIPGLWLAVVGAAGLIAVTLERTRYGSEAADRSWGATGPAGTDDRPVDPRFRATDERFVDPTTRRTMRVWADPATGERRYRLDE